MNKQSLRTAAFLTLNIAAVCVLGFYSTTAAAPQGQPPFIDPVEQRGEMIQQLREIKDLLKEQNALLRSGATKAAVHDAPKR